MKTVPYKSCPENFATGPAPARMVGIGWRGFCANRCSDGWPGTKT